MLTKKMLLITLGFSILTVNANAEAQRDCRIEVENQLMEKLKEGPAEDFEARKIDLRRAVKLTLNEGYLQGESMVNALLKFSDADLIYSLISSVRGGTATDLITVKNNGCKVVDVIRVQEE